MGDLAFNTAIARLFELNNHLTQVAAREGRAPREAVDPLVRMVAPLAPHIAEELWERLGGTGSVAFAPFPHADPQYLAVDTVEIAVQVNGKVRAQVTVPTGADEAAHEAGARADAKIRAALDGKQVVKVVVVAGRLVNFVVR
jgi:leucyl-tRNA synthetase